MGYANRFKLGKGLLGSRKIELDQVRLITLKIADLAAIVIKRLDFPE